MSNKIQLSNKKPLTFQRHPNNTATVKCVIMHTQDKEVSIRNDGKLVGTQRLDDKFLIKLKNDFNKTHSGLFKRYPKLLCEHEETVNSVVGRFNSKIDHIIDGGVTKLIAEVLITDEKIVNEMDSNAAPDYYLSIGLESDKDTYDFKIAELSMTLDPVLPDTIMLSNASQYDTNISKDYINLSDKMEDIKNKLISSRKKDKIKIELNNQVRRNIILRRDVDKILPIIEDMSVPNVRALFECFAPLRKNNLTKLNRR